jgi:CRP/FNR family transcriptional regulator
MTLSCDVCALSDICLPAGLNDSELALLEKSVLVGQKLKKGEMIYAAGEAFSGLYAVKSGSFKSAVSNSDGDAQIVGFHMPGELVGFDGYDSIHTSSVVALENSMVCKIPGSHLDFLCSNIKSVSRHIHSMIANDVRAHNSVLMLIAQKSAENRVICFLKNISDRNKKRGFSATDFTLSMPRGDIANFLGMAPETISRLLSQLQDEKIVEFDRRNVHIMNYDELARRSCGHEGQSVVRA